VGKLVDGGTAGIGRADYTPLVEVYELELPGSGDIFWLSKGVLNLMGNSIGNLGHSISHRHDLSKIWPNDLAVRGFVLTSIDRSSNVVHWVHFERRPKWISNPKIHFATQNARLFESVAGRLVFCLLQVDSSSYSEMRQRGQPMGWQHS
jgi:hypothetical protein